MDASESTLDMETTADTKRAPSDSKTRGETTQKYNQIMRLSSESVGSALSPPLSAFDAGVPAVTESLTSGGFKGPVPGADLCEAITTHDSHRT